MVPAWRQKPAGQKYNNNMQRYSCLLILLLTSLAAQAQSAYTARELQISFYSKMPLKEFEAYSTTGSSSIRPARQEVQFSVDVSSFVFYRLLMQEHFNRDYMESHRYSKASFKGNFVEPVDFDREGRQEVSVEGVLDIHGKKSRRSIDGVLEIRDGSILLFSEFLVNCREHGILIPESLSGQIAPDIRVKVRGEYAPDNLVKK